MTSSGGGNGNWCTIESDPGVFTSLIESFGVKNVELSELWSLDDDSLRHLTQESGKVYGLIFLFKWQQQHHQELEKKEEKEEEKAGNTNTNNDTRVPLAHEDAPQDLYFAKQVTTNACATQAILSVLLNSTSDGTDSSSTDQQQDKDGDATMVDTSSSTSPPSASTLDGKLILGPTLSALKSFTQTFPPDLRGEAIEASDEIREAHNSFARKDSFLTEERKTRIATDEDDVFHFVAYIPFAKDGMVYELDGLQSGPIRIGPYTKESEEEEEEDDMSWLQVARAAIQDRIERYASEEIKFNLMAVVRDRRCTLQSKLNMLLQEGATSAEEAEEDETVVHIKAELAAEEEKRKQWEIENERRRHNYLPFCVELIRALAGSGKLPELTQKANDRVAETRKKAMEAKAMAASKGL